MDHIVARDKAGWNPDRVELGFASPDDGELGGFEKAVAPGAHDGDEANNVGR
jgi:hypothetical protein